MVSLFLGSPFRRTPESSDSSLAERRGRWIPAFAGMTSYPSRKLPQEAHVVLEERAQVGDAITQHRQALDAHAEGKTGVALRVDAAVGQHGGMDHAAAEYFEPARAAVGQVPADHD